MVPARLSGENGGPGVLALRADSNHVENPWLLAQCKLLDPRCLKENPEGRRYPSMRCVCLCLYTYIYIVHRGLLLQEPQSGCVVDAFY